MDGERELISARDVKGLKYLDGVLPLLRRLHGVGCGRDKAGNRDLHMDQFCVLILLYLFSPVVDSLRGIQRVSEPSSPACCLACGPAASRPRLPWKCFTTT